MKNKKNLIAVLSIVLLFVVAYTIPILVTSYEDKHLQYETKNYEIEEIKLNSEKVDLKDKLATFQQILTEDIVVQESQKEEQSYESVGKKVEEFLFVLSGENWSEFLKYSVKSVALADSESGTVCSFWKCRAIAEGKCEYVFWLDIEKEKVLSFEITFEDGKFDAESIYLMMERLREYYGFANVELVGEAKDFLKKEYSETALHFFDEDGIDIVLMLYKKGNVLSFNKYPGEVTVYDTMTESD